MGNGNRQDPPYTSGYYPQLTDKQLEEFRGLVDRGLRTDARPSETLASMYDAKRGQILGCSDQNTLNGLAGTIDALEQLPPNGDLPSRPIIVFDRPTLRRLIIVGNTVAMFHNRTPCLLRLAALMDKCLSRDLYTRFRSDFFDLVEVLIGIGDDVIRRTQKPYKAFGDLQVNPPLDAKVLQIEPLSQYRHWQSLLDVRSGKAVISTPTAREEARFNVDDKDGWKQTLDEIERNLEERRVETRITAAAAGDAPEINRQLENLRNLKFSDIERQTRARFPMHWRDDKVIDHVELIIYNSVYSALLGKDGNPLFLKGVAPYSLLIPEPGEHLLRNFHPAGLYLSAGGLADYQFVVSGLKVKSLLLGGITSFTRRQSTFTFEHELQKHLQSYIRVRSIHAIAAITVQEAFKSGELSISAVRRAMPDLIDETTRYAVLELMKRLEKLFDNYEQILKDVGKQVIKEIITQKVKAWAKEWLIKKIGKKIIPGVNVASAIADLMDDEQTEMIRAMIGCIVMATKSKRRDDLAISSKVLAKISLDKVQEAVIKELVKKGGKLASKSGKSSDKNKGATDEPKAKPADAPVPGKPPMPADSAQSAKPTSTPDTPTTSGQGQAKHMTQREIADTVRLAQKTQQPQRPQHQQLQQQQTKIPSKTDPAVTDKATEAKAVKDKGTEPVADKPAATRPVKEKGAEPETVQLQPGVYRRRGGERKSEAPPLPRKDEPEQKVDRGQDIADSHRALTKRGAKDDRGTDPNVHPSQSRPESVAAARQAGVPTEVANSGYVMTRADVPAAAPDRPVPRGRQAPPALPTTRPVSRSEVQNTEVQADIELTLRSLPPGTRLVDTRVNQTQTATDGGRAGTNRPDLQLTIVQAELPNGRRVHIEYDRSPPTRAMDHAQRILANDPDAIVILKIIDFEPPNRPRPPGRR